MRIDDAMQKGKLDDIIRLDVIRDYTEELSKTNVEWQKAFNNMQWTEGGKDVRCAKMEAGKILGK